MVEEEAHDWQLQKTLSHARAVAVRPSQRTCPRRPEEGEHGIWVVVAMMVRGFGVESLLLEEVVMAGLLPAFEMAAGQEEGLFDWTT